jgi:hypothetical protein
VPAFKTHLKALRAKRGVHEQALFDALLNLADEEDDEFEIGALLEASLRASLRDVYIPCSGPAKGNHRPDILLPVSDTYAIVIEVDEHAHGGYDKQCERARQDRIQNTLFAKHGINCVTFIRFNPHGKGAKLHEKVYDTLCGCVIDGEETARASPTLVHDVFIGYTPEQEAELKRVEKEMRERQLALFGDGEEEEEEETLA